MPWWGWIVIGSLLFGVELFAIDAAFYLTFLGVAALFVGAVGVASFEIPNWAQWLLFAILSIACMLTFRRKLYNQIRNKKTPAHKGAGAIFLVAGAPLSNYMQIEIEPFPLVA